jgi:hypothetical protein
MVKKSILAVAILAMLAGSLQAANVNMKGHPYDWPVSYDWVNLLPEGKAIPVYMDIGWYIFIENYQNLKIKIRQLPGSVMDYEGCTDVTIKTNGTLQIRAQLDQFGLVDGDWKTPTVSPGLITQGTNKVTVCVKVTSVELYKKSPEGGQNCVHVGNVRLQVRPDSAAVIPEPGC